MKINRYIEFLKENILSKMPNINQLKDYFQSLIDDSVDGAYITDELFNKAGDSIGYIVEMKFGINTKVDIDVKHIVDNIKIDYPDLHIFYTMYKYTSNLNVILTYDREFVVNGELSFFKEII